MVSSGYYERIERGKDSFKSRVAKAFKTGELDKDSATLHDDIAKRFNANVSPKFINEAIARSTWV